MPKNRSVIKKTLGHIGNLFSQEQSRRPDWVFFGMSIVLLCVGLIVLTSASSAVGLKNFDDTYYFLKQQLSQGVLIGFVGGLLLYNIKISFLKKYSLHFFVLSLVLLILVLIPQFGDTRLGASRWLVLGPISFQPSELVKFTFVLYLAAWLEAHQATIKHFKQSFIPFVVIVAVVAGLLLLQPDLGTTGIFVLIALTMYFVAGGALPHISLFGLGGIVSVWLLIKTAPYRAARLTTFLNPDADPQGLGYHINQALLAIGSGGWFGRGLGHSRQKFQYLPESYGDSIFAVLAEELGFVATSIIVMLFIYYFVYAFRLSKRVDDMYESLVIVGLVAWLGWQSVINIGAMVGLLPLTGVPWPFVSYGSTSLVINLASIGLILQISRQLKRK